MRICILTIGSRGDIQPYLALGQGLLAAGYQVCVAAHACWESFVRSNRLDYRPVAGDPRGTLEGEAGLQWLESGRNPLNFMGGLMRAAQPVIWQMADDYLAACRDADAILYPALAALPAASIAEKLGVPAYASYLNHVHPTRTYPSAVLPPLPRLGGAYNLFTYALGTNLFWTSMRSFINRWRRERLGLRPYPWGGPFNAWLAERKPSFYGFSPAVIPRAPEWGDEVHITGYWFLKTVDPNRAAVGWEPPQPLIDFLAAGPPPVFVGFGSMTGRRPEQVTGLVLEALARSHQRGILLAGWGGLRPADLPDHVLAIDAAPFDWLFPQMAAVVHHGGAGTTAAGLAAGKPSVVVPFFGDQYFWGWRVAALGAGPQPIPRNRLSAERLAAAITRATAASEMRARAEALGRQICSEDGVATFVAGLKSCLSRAA